MKHSIQLPACPIKVLINDSLPQLIRQMNCVSIFGLNSQPAGLSLKHQQRGATEESATMYQEPLPDNNISVNSAITLQEA